MNEKFRTIGLDTEDKITEFIDYIDDLEDTEEIKSDVYGFFEEDEYSCAMKSHFRKFGNQMSGSGNHLCNYASLLA